MDDDYSDFWLNGYVDETFADAVSPTRQPFSPTSVGAPTPKSTPPPSLRERAAQRRSSLPAVSQTTAARTSARRRSAAPSPTPPRSTSGRKSSALVVIERIQTDVLELSEPSLTPTDAFRRRGIERTLSKMQQLPFLRDFVLSREHLAEFSAFCDPLVFEKGEDLLVRGRSGEHMLFLLSGSAEVKVGPKRCVAIVAPDVCGECCMANPGRKRNASVTATTRIECLKLSRRRLFLLYEYFAVDDGGAEAEASKVQVG